MCNYVAYNRFYKRRFLHLLSIIVDNILMLNCLVLSGLIVSEGLRKSSPNVTIFFLQISVSIR